MPTADVLEIVKLALEVLIIPAFGWIWRTWRKDVKNDGVRSFMDDAVRAAEELEKSKKLTKDMKPGWVLEQAERKYPGISRNVDEYKVLVHGALQAAGLGASAKFILPASEGDKSLD